MKTSELSGVALDWAVAKAQGYDITYAGMLTVTNIDGRLYILGPAPSGELGSRYTPSTDWSQGGPILTEARISRTCDHSGLWVAYYTWDYGDCLEDRSELIAGLRCFVEKTLGAEVDIPATLI